jgi:FAD/FMN-containing dehydrogenase
MQTREDIDVDRRRFLELSSAATAAVLASCGGGGDSSTSVSIGTPPAAAGPSDAEWQTLAGSVIRPGNAGYLQARVVFNSRYDSVLPLAVVRCANPGDVAAVLAFVQRHRLAVTAKSGGHSFAGHSTGTGVVIDVGPMNAIQVGNDGTATIGAGAKLADVYDQLIARGVAIPSGTCLSVGIAGITMGGGIGLVDRMYGLTCDNLLAAQVVLADGALVTCDAVNEPELFWALRGGGGGNFGVATSFTFRTHATRDLANFSATFAFQDAAKVLAAWQTWQYTLPDNIWSYLIFTFFSPGQPPSLTVSGVCVGSPAEFAPFWNAFLSATQSASAAHVNVLSYRDTMMAFCAGKTVSQCHLPGQTPDAQLQRAAFASSSDFFDAPLPAEGIQALLQAMTTAQSAGIRGQILLDAMGGALGRVAPDATAFAHRGAMFSAEYYMDAAGVGIGTPAWPNGMRATMRPWSSGRAYVNYMDPLIADPAVYYGANYARLVRAKGRYDPNRVFNPPQGIPPA